MFHQYLNVVGIKFSWEDKTYTRMIFVFPFENYQLQEYNLNYEVFLGSVLEHLLSFVTCVCICIRYSCLLPNFPLGWPMHSPWQCFCLLFITDEPLLRDSSLDKKRNFIQDYLLCPGRTTNQRVQLEGPRSDLVKILNASVEDDLHFRTN